VIFVHLTGNLQTMVSNFDFPALLYKIHAPRLDGDPGPMVILARW
jgi:hypothetical protein